MKRFFVMSLVGLTWVCLTQQGSAEVVSLTTDERAAVESKFPSTKGRPLADGPGVFPDGAKGYEARHIKPRDALETRPIGSENGDKVLREQVCATQLIVLAVAGPSATYLSQHRSSVLTETAFTIQETVLDSTALVGKKAIYVVREGGDALDNGQLVRVSFAGRSAYKAGQQYLLRLTPDKTLNLFYAVEGTTQLVNGRLQTDDNFMGFPSGTSLAAVKVDLRRVVASSPCARK